MDIDLNVNVETIDGTGQGNLTYSWRGNQAMSWQINLEMRD
jgi:hypothetical protein